MLLPSSPTTSVPGGNEACHQDSFNGDKPTQQKMTSFQTLDFTPSRHGQHIVENTTHVEDNECPLGASLLSETQFDETRTGIGPKLLRVSLRVRPQTPPLLVPSDAARRAPMPRYCLSSFFASRRLGRFALLSAYPARHRTIRTQRTPPQLIHTQRLHSLSGRLELHMLEPSAPPQVYVPSVGLGLPRYSFLILFQLHATSGGCRCDGVLLPISPVSRSLLPSCGNPLRATAAAARHPDDENNKTRITEGGKTKAKKGAFIKGVSFIFCKLRCIRRGTTR